MVALDVVKRANVDLVQQRPIVAVFTGGTAGIGEATIRALAAAHGQNGPGLRVYIVGRNKAAAEKIIADCQQLCSKGIFIFVKAEDLSLLKDVDKVCDQIKQLEAAQNDGKPRIDLLVMSQGYLTFDGRLETSEGLDTLLSLRYYSRMKLVVNLAPLLHASSLPARVVSVFAPGYEGKLFTDDLTLRDPSHYNMFNGFSHVAYMTTFSFEKLAVQHAGKVGFVHFYPGMVNTDEVQKGKFPWWFKMFHAWIAMPLIGFFKAVPIEECGERTLFLASPRYPPQTTDRSSTGEKEQLVGGPEIALGVDGKPGSGVYAVDWNGETVPHKTMDKAYTQHRERGVGEQIWDHTMKAFEEIAANRKFRE